MLKDRLREARKACGMSRSELSKLSGVPYSTIADLENGGMKTTTYLLELAGPLGIRPEWLRSGEKPMASATKSSGAKPKLTPELMANRYEQDIDQLRNTIFLLIDVFSARLPGAASELLSRLPQDDPRDPEYDEKGFAARLLSSLRNIARTEADEATRAPRRASHGPSGRKRAP